MSTRRRRHISANHWMLDALLACIALLRAPLTLLGVEFEKFRALLEVKLKLDFRHEGRQTKSPMAGGIVLTCTMYTLLGAMLGAAAYLIRDPFAFTTLAMTSTLVMVGMALIVDFTNVLLDTADVTVVNPCPVQDRTLLVARVAHVTVYLGMIAGCLSIGPLILGACQFGPWPYLLAYAASVTLTCMLTIALVTLLYVACMRLFDPERFKDVIVYVQIGASLVVFGSYQLLPRLGLVQHSLLEAIDRDPWWMFLLPPFYFGALHDVLAGGASPRRMALAALGVVLPVLALVLAIRVISRHFAASLSGLAVARSAQPRTARRTGTLMPRLAQLCTRGGAERAGFDFFLKLAARERLFKLRTYPMLLLAPLLIIMNQASAHWANLGYAFYFALLYVPPIIFQARFSENHEARWIFTAAPLAIPALVFSGTVRAICVVFVLPYMLLLSAIALGLKGLDLLPDVLLASEFALALAMLSAMMLDRALPFTRKPTPADGTSNTLLFLALSIVVGVAVLIHWLVRMHPISTWGMIVVLAATIPLLARKLRTLKVALEPGRDE